MLKLAYKVGSRGGTMVSTSARNAGDPWFESRSWYDRFLYFNIHLFIYICIYVYNKKSVSSFANALAKVKSVVQLGCLRLMANWGHQIKI